MDNVYYCISKFDVCCDSVWIDGFRKMKMLKKIRDHGKIIYLIGIVIAIIVGLFQKFIPSFGKSIIIVVVFMAIGAFIGVVNVGVKNKPLFVLVSLLIGFSIAMILSFTNIIVGIIPILSFIEYLGFVFLNVIFVTIFAGIVIVMIDK